MKNVVVRGEDRGGFELRYQHSRGETEDNHETPVSTAIVRAKFRTQASDNKGGVLAAISRHSVSWYKLPIYFVGMILLTMNRQ
jgi:hypothetical protein